MRCDYVSRKTTSSAESKTLHLESQELVDLLRALELVAKRRGLVDPTGN